MDIPLLKEHLRIMTNGFDARIPEKEGPGTSADTATAFAKTVSYPFLLTLNLAMKRQKE